MARVPARRGQVYNFGHSLTLDRVCRGLRKRSGGCRTRTRSLPAISPCSL